MATYRATVRWLRLWILLALVLSGCSVVRSNEQHPDVELGNIFPTRMPPTGPAQLLDVNGDGQNEWLIFYHVDLIEDNVDKSPIIGSVYHPVPDLEDNRMPPRIVPMLLWLPRQGYLCSHSCEAKMEDIITGDSQEELVIQDKQENVTVGVAIFRWKKETAPEGSPEQGKLVPVGEFRGDSITVIPDEIVVVREAGERSGLATQEKYRPANGRYYIDEPPSVDDPQVVVVKPYEAEVVFGSGPPEDPASVKLPEKLVLALYNDFTDLERIETYFVPETWESMGRSCAAGVCGCQSNHQEISRVMVKLLAYQADQEPTVKTVVRVLCVRTGDQKDQRTTVTWTLQRQDDGTWRLLQVSPGGEEMLPELITVQS